MLKYLLLLTAALAVSASAVSANASSANSASETAGCAGKAQSNCIGECEWSFHNNVCAAMCFNATSDMSIAPTSIQCSNRGAHCVYFQNQCYQPSCYNLYPNAADAADCDNDDKCVHDGTSCTDSSTDSTPSPTDPANPAPSPTNATHVATKVTTGHCSDIGCEEVDTEEDCAQASDDLGWEGHVEHIWSDKYTSPRCSHEATGDYSGTNFNLLGETEGAVPCGTHGSTCACLCPSPTPEDEHNFSDQGEQSCLDVTKYSMNYLLQDDDAEYALDWDLFYDDVIHMNAVCSLIDTSYNGTYHDDHYECCVPRGKEVLNGRCWHNNPSYTKGDEFLMINGSVYCLTDEYFTLYLSSHLPEDITTPTPTEPNPAPTPATPTDPASSGIEGQLAELNELLAALRNDIESAETSVDAIKRVKAASAAYF